MSQSLPHHRSQAVDGPAPARAGVSVAAPAGWVMAFVGYLLLGQFGMLFMLPEHGVSVIWPAAGVALAAAWWWGAGGAIAAGGGAILMHLWVDHSPTVAVSAGIGVALAAWLGALLLARLDFRPDLGRLRDVFAMIGVGVVLASGVSSLTGGGIMYVTGLASADSFVGLWWICWVADMLGVLLVFPVLMTAAGTRSSWRVSDGETLLLGTLAATVTWVVYSDVLPSGIAMTQPLTYLIFPVMIWAAVRTGPGRVAMILLLHATLAVAYTAANQGPFAMGELRESLLSLHGHLAMLSATALLLAALLLERRTAVEELSRSESKYRLVVDNQTDLVVSLERGGRISFASPSACAILGASGADPVGRDFGALVAGAEAVERLLRAPNRVGGRVEFEAPATTADGTRWLAWAARAIDAEDGDCGGAVVVGRDVTERRRAEAEAREYLRELAHAGRVGAMGEMAAGLAHELNQPLCAIATYSQACQRLSNDSTDPDLRGAIERVGFNAQRAGDIVRRMRGFVRNEELEPEAVALDTLVRDAVDLVEPETTRHGVSVRTELASDLPPVRAVPIHVDQILVNLVRNAVEVLRDAPTREIVIRTEAASDGILLSVADTGPGISPELVDRLFQPFVSGRGRGQGLGLGLTISRSLAEHCGGRLEAENRADRSGARFTLFLPTWKEGGS